MPQGSSVSLGAMLVGSRSDSEDRDGRQSGRQWPATAAMRFSQESVIRRQKIVLKSHSS